MEVQVHTTPETRQALRSYLRDRRMTTSFHQTVTALTLSDLEEALRLLQGIQHPSEAWTDEVEAFLDRTLCKPAPNPAWALPGLLDGK